MDQLMREKTDKVETIITDKYIHIKPDVNTAHIIEMEIDKVQRVEKKGFLNVLVNDGTQTIELYCGNYADETIKFLNKEITAEEYKNTVRQSKITINIIVGIVFVILFWIMYTWLFGGDEPSASSSSYSQPVAQTVSQSQLSSVRSSLSSWSEGRWDDWTADITSDGELLVRVYANRLSNQTAIDNYCDVLEMEANNAVIPQSQRGLYIYQSGELVKSCL